MATLQTVFSINANSNIQANVLNPSQILAINIWTLLEMFISVPYDIRGRKGDGVRLGLKPKPPTTSWIMTPI